MAETILGNDACIGLGSIDGEGDLKLRPGLLNINPPPSDARCQCCGKHLNELKPFGKAGDPLAGDFDGALLVKKWRPDAPHDEEAERIYEKYLASARSESRVEQLMALDYGKEEAERIILTVQAAGCVGASWECRECAVLSDQEYFEKLRQRQGTGMRVGTLADLADPL